MIGYRKDSVLPGPGSGRDEHVTTAKSRTQRFVLMGEQRRELSHARQRRVHETLLD